MQSRARIVRARQRQPAINGTHQSFEGNRLQQIIHRGQSEGLDCEDFEGGDKNDTRIAIALSTSTGHLNRQSVVEGKWGSVRLELCGPWFLKKKKTKKKKQ